MTVLIGFDDTAYGRDALELGLQLAGTTGEPVTVATVFPDDDHGLMVAIQDRQWVNQVRQVAERKLDVARQALGDRAGVRFEAIGPASAARALHEYAEEIKASLLVLGSSHHGAIGRIAPGSTVERLLHGSPCPLAVAPRGYRKHAAPLKEVAVAYDGSPESQHALDVAVEIAQRCDASLRLVGVAAKHEEQLQARLDAGAARVPAGVKATAEVLVDSHVVDTLADLPGQTPDLLVCGSRGYGPARQVLLGGVSSRLVRSAAYPVIVVPRGATTHPA